MHLEKLRQQRTRRLGHVRARAVFNLRQIGLTNGCLSSPCPTWSSTSSHFLTNGAHDLLLRHGTTQTAQRSFHLAQVTDFLAQFHISIRNIYIAYCDISQELDLL